MVLLVALLTFQWIPKTTKVPFCIDIFSTSVANLILYNKVLSSMHPVIIQEICFYLLFKLVGVSHINGEV